MISDEAVIAAAKVLYADKISNHAGDNAPQIIDACEKVARRALEAAAPHMLAEDRAEVWAEGHEEGFWNGRLSSGDTTGVPLIGKEHADATNPYRSQE